MKTEPQAEAKSTQKTKKKHPLLKIFIGILVAIIVIIALLPFFINPIVDPIVKQEIKNIFGDKLKIDSVNVSFLTGTSVYINHIELRQPAGFGQGDIMKAASVKISLDLMPLLKKRVLIREVTVIRPEIRIIQYRNSLTNVSVLINQFTKPAGSTKTSQSDYTVHLNQFEIKNGQIILNSYSLSDNYQPTLIFTDANIRLTNIEIPNVNKIASRFSISGLLGTKRPAPVRVNGTGVFGSSKLSFVAKSKIDNLTLTDYTYLMPADMSVTVKSGRAWVTSDARCNNNYIHSSQHVTLKDLKLTAKRHSLTGALMGVPANVLIKVIADSKNTFSFDFTLNGYFDDIKVNLKLKVFEAVGKGISSKLGLGKFSHGVGTGIKNVGKKISGSFKGLFHRKK